MIHKQTITEALADYMVTTNCDSTTASEALAERFFEDITKAENIDPDFDEADYLFEALMDVIDSCAEDAELLVKEWNEDTRQMEEERREALRGRY